MSPDVVGGRNQEAFLWVCNGGIRQNAKVHRTSLARFLNLIHTNPPICQYNPPPLAAAKKNQRPAVLVSRKSSSQVRTGRHLLVSGFDSCRTRRTPPRRHRPLLEAGGGGGPCPQPEQLESHTSLERPLADLLGGQSADSTQGREEWGCGASVAPMPGGLLQPGAFIFK